MFFEGQVYDWGRFQNAGPNTRTKITPGPSYPPPPTPEDLSMFWMPVFVSIFSTLS